MLDVLGDLLAKREPLNANLRPYIIQNGPLGPMIQHPLVQEISYSEAMNALINKRYETKLEALNQCEAAKKWTAAIWFHERPWRMDALLRYQKQMTDTEYWEAVGAVWTDSENIWQNSDSWRTLWESRRPEKRHAMDTEERHRLALMPDVITVYRGVQGLGITKARRRIGLSWTTDRAQAEKFSKRWDYQPQRILEGTVKKTEVHAYFIGRNESEIVSSKVKISTSN